MADDEKDGEKSGKPSNITYLKSIKGKKELAKEKSLPRKGNPNRPKSKADVFITDERFKRAMELIQDDMNQALTLSQRANTQLHFLFQFLAKNGIIKLDEYEQFLDKELKEIQSLAEKE